MLENLIQGKAVTVEEVFTGRRYQLDSYQRGYTWGRGDVRRLVEDLRRKFLKSWRMEHDRDAVADYAPYFLGPYVYHEAAAVTYLVDGQQRITTLHLLLLYLKELLRAQDLEEDAERIGALSRTRKYGRSVYTLDIAERESFLSTVFQDAGYTLPADAPGDLRRLWEAAQVFQEEFPEDLSGDALPYFVDWLLDGVCMVGIRAATQGQGMEIYESMNDRGVRLGPIDLLKSYLLSNITGETAGCDNTWRSMVNALAAVDPNAPSDFVKTFFIARFARIDEGGNSQDVEEINGLYHTWLKGNEAQLGLKGSHNFRALVTELRAFSDYYCTLAAAARSYREELASVFFNTYNGMTSQAAPILAAIDPGDDTGTFKLKARLIADYLDLVFVRRLVNDAQYAGSQLDREAVRLVGQFRGRTDVAKLRRILSAEVARLNLDFASMATFGLRSNNSRQVRYLLARLTAFVQIGCGRPDESGNYLNEHRPFEIEHIWANQFERFQPQTRTRAEFDSQRNRLGALLLLHKSDNASYQDLPYSRKVDYYQRQSHLAASLHVKHRERNPQFRAFIKEHKLDGLFRPYTEFTKKDIATRQQLYQRLCEIIWSDSLFGTPDGVVRPIDRTRTRTRARYDVAVQDLVAKGLIPVSTKLVGRRRGESFQAVVLEDGRIRVASGEVFGSLSAAGSFVLQTKACPGWNFWHAKIGAEEKQLLRIRKEALEQGLI
ncbi:DUF262 domain-containing protein [Streptomyces sp. RKCA744]|uniref:GmrSD restriction endonuclease domain-containing protein n=1 Tax=Streptomyces sp. RKCA744 TaxID=2959340 RepID=UPI0020A03D82|nr:DUF262 domain-containing protein [Streptomyces sp. RKCA744]MCO8307300.1 DUF262 domain-containing protein [Streptomyces sp. RKCA744]